MNKRNAPKETTGPHRRQKAATILKEWEAHLFVKVKWDQTDRDCTLQIDNFHSFVLPAKEMKAQESRCSRLHSGELPGQGTRASQHQGDLCLNSSGLASLGIN